jgi:hypothetical protein
VTTPKHWIAETVEAALAAQGIALAPGRAERVARGQQALVDASASDRLRAALEFDADATAFVRAMEKCK